MCIDAERRYCNRGGRGDEVGRAGFLIVGGKADDVGGP